MHHQRNKNINTKESYLKKIVFIMLDKDNIFVMPKINHFELEKKKSLSVTKLKKLAENDN